MKHTTKSIILSRADIDELGFDSSTLTDEQFQKIGERAGEYIMENWWIALEELCKDMKPLTESNPS